MVLVAWRGRPLKLTDLLQDRELPAPGSDVEADEPSQLVRLALVGLVGGAVHLPPGVQPGIQGVGHLAGLRPRQTGTELKLGRLKVGSPPGLALTGPRPARRGLVFPSDVGSALGQE